MAKYGKDSPERFIDGALDGDTGGDTSPKGYQNTQTSNEMDSIKISRKDQSVLRSYALDNVGRVYGRYATSMKDMGGWAGGATSLKHSLEGASTIGPDEVGAASKVKHVIIPNH
jgi:hypothetical protein